MDIKELDSFFDYKLTFDEDPVFLLDEIIKQASKYLTPDQLEEIRHAYVFTKAAHA
jgi:hypothetical protein